MAQNAFCRAFSQTFSDCRRYELMGLKMGVVVLCNEPSFSSQTKEKLADVDGFKSSGDYEVSSLAKEFKKIFEKNYEIFKNPSGPQSDLASAEPLFVLSNSYACFFRM